MCRCHLLHFSIAYIASLWFKLYGKNHGTKLMLCIAHAVLCYAWTFTGEPSNPASEALLKMAMLMILAMMMFIVDWQTGD